MNSGVTLNRFNCIFFLLVCTFQNFTRQQHPKDTPANAPLPLQPLDYREVTKIELDPACSARADLSGITMQQVHAILHLFARCIV